MLPPRHLLSSFRLLADLMVKVSSKLCPPPAKIKTAKGGQDEPLVISVIECIRTALRSQSCLQPNKNAGCGRRTVEKTHALLQSLSQRSSYWLAPSWPASDVKWPVKLLKGMLPKFIELIAWNAAGEGLVSLKLE
jgi:hypothetical protein